MFQNLKLPLLLKLLNCINFKNRPATISKKESLIKFKQYILELRYV